jgi:putative redox protein
MKVTITHKEAMKFEAQTAKSSFIIDCPVISPVEYFLSGLITCSATDLIVMPKKQGYDVTNLTVTGEVVRAQMHPRKFDTLHLDFSFDSSADDTLAARWVMASLETYCSTLNTVRDSVKISYTIVYNGRTIRKNEAMISGGGSETDFGDIGGCPS